MPAPRLVDGSGACCVPRVAEGSSLGSSPALSCRAGGPRGGESEVADGWVPRPGGSPGARGAPVSGLRADAAVPGW